MSNLERALADFRALALSPTVKRYVALGQRMQSPDAEVAAQAARDGKILPCPVCGCRTNMLAWHMESHR